MHNLLVKRKAFIPFCINYKTLTLKSISNFRSESQLSPCVCCCLYALSSVSLSESSLNSKDLKSDSSCSNCRFFLWNKQEMQTEKVIQKMTTMKMAGRTSMTCMMAEATFCAVSASNTTASRFFVTTQMSVTCVQRWVIE